MKDAVKLIVTCALIEKEGKVLINQRSGEMSLSYLWEFPGGKLEPGEDLLECIHREIDEELSLQIEVTGKLPAPLHPYPGKILELVPYLARITGGEMILHEHTGAAWVDRHTILGYRLAPADEKVWQTYLDYLDAQDAA